MNQKCANQIAIFELVWNIFQEKDEQKIWEKVLKKY